MGVRPTLCLGKLCASLVSEVRASVRGSCGEDLNSSAASACGFSSLPLAAGEKLLAGVVLSERAMVQGGVGSFLAAMQLQRLQKQRSSAFAVIRAFYPLAPPDALDGRRLHIAFASKDLGFSSVGQLVLRAIPACKKYVWLYCDLVHLCADQWSARVAVVALHRVIAVVWSRR